MVVDQTQLLERSDARWQLRPLNNAKVDPDMEFDSSKFSLMIFLRNLNMSEARHEDFISAIANAEGADEKETIMHALANAVQGLRFIGEDYVELGNGKRRRIDMYGESQAEFVLKEHDQLMDLARTVWTNPEKPVDFIAEAYAQNLRALGEEEEPTIDDLFGWARSWAEVRYRFLNHALRDDPNLWLDFCDGRPRRKGDAANSIVHDSNVLEDARLVEFKVIGNFGYSKADRRIFESLYMITPEEGRKLFRFASKSTGLRPGLPTVFRFCATFIDVFIDWRIKMLTRARQSLLSCHNVKETTSFADRKREIGKQHKLTASRLKNVDDIYSGRFIPTLRSLLREAEEDNAFNRDTFNKLESVVERVKVALSNSPFNSIYRDLKNDASYRKIITNFPGVNLIAPTGTALVVKSRPSKRLKPF
ncbi:hypothetical protein GGR50DRAFT_161530 [Xylaria sp. CBS 124048]|nr:hypothetical protein GGR50DRAFT_161530 [Xylaria sp. CBS 124048]